MHDGEYGGWFAAAAGTGPVDTAKMAYAQAHGWLAPEHFDESWNFRLDYNRELPADPFRPYGATIGHLLEWARLAAAFTVATVTGEQSYADWHEKLWAHADRYFIDHERGSWRHELDPQNRPAATV